MTEQLDSFESICHKSTAVTIINCDSFIGYSIALGLIKTTSRPGFCKFKVRCGVAFAERPESKMKMEHLERQGAEVVVFRYESDEELASLVRRSDWVIIIPE